LKKLDQADFRVLLRTFRTDFHDGLNLRSQNFALSAFRKGGFGTISAIATSLLIPWAYAAETFENNE
jgi:hypothetical protein